MKTHYCPADKATISYEGECNWCGEKEMKTVIEMAREAGFASKKSENHVLYDALECFAALVREDEREKQQWRDLTDEEIQECWHGTTKEGWIGFVRAVIAKFKEKQL